MYRLFLKSLSSFLILCSCASNAQIARYKALQSLSQYDISNITEPKITVCESVEIVTALYFMETGKYKTTPGFYDSGECEIVIWKDALFPVWLHEFQHYYLDSAGVPIPQHHKIMGCE